MSFTTVERVPPRLNRSQLFVPGVRPALFEKAAAGDADVICLDLEDSVAPADKPQARANVVQALKTQNFGTKSISVCINGLDTPYCYRDVVDIVEQAGERLDLIMIPKVGIAADIYAIDMLITQIETAVRRKKQLKLEVIIAVGHADRFGTDAYNLKLSEKRADAVPDYTTGQPFWEKAVGKDNLVRLPWVQYGFDTYSMSIMASEKTIRERPKVLRDFLAASYQGWRDVMENPKAALEIFQKRVPDIDPALIEPNMMLGLELMKTDRYAANGIGWMDRAKMCRTVELINTYMPDMPRKTSCEEIFTNEFLTKVEVPKR